MQCGSDEDKDETIIYLREADSANSHEQQSVSTLPDNVQAQQSVSTLQGHVQEQQSVSTLQDNALEQQSVSTLQDHVQEQQRVIQFLMQQLSIAKSG